MSANVASMPPAVEPTVTIGGVTLSVRFSILAQFLLDTMDPPVDIARLPETFANMMEALPPPPGPDGKPRLRPRPGTVALFTRLFSAMVAHNYVERGAEPLTPIQWASRFSSNEDFKAACDAVSQALVKARTASAPARLPQSTETAGQQPN